MNRIELMIMKGELVTEIELAQNKLQQVNVEIMKCFAEEDTKKQEIAKQEADKRLKEDAAKADTLRAAPLRDVSSSKV